MPLFLRSASALGSTPSYAKSEASAVCKGAVCPDDESLADSDAALTSAVVADVAFIVGALAVTSGIIVLALDPHAGGASPRVSANMGGVELTLPF